MQIYKITNIINNKIYIGKDTKDNPTYFGSGKLIKRAIKKYGISNFIKEIIDYSDNNEELCIKEIYWIKFYDATNPKIGYNIMDGDEEISLEFILTDDHKMNISKSQLELWKDPNYKDKIINLLKDIWKDLEYKKIFTESQKSKHNIKRSTNTKNLMSERAQGKYIGEKNPMYGTSFFKKWVEIYGEEKALIMKKDVYKKRKPLKEQLIEKYGIEEGMKKWGERNKKISDSNKERSQKTEHPRKGIKLKDSLIEKYGIEKAEYILKEREKKRLESFLKNRKNDKQK